MIRLNPRAKAPLYEQIYLQIRDGIANGTYPPKSKLASIRELAEQLHCSRNTVEAAYRMLLQEGFVYSKPGSGVIVEEHLPSGFRPVDVDSAEDAAAISESSAILYDFTYGNLENGTFPALLWKSITDDVLLSVDSAQANCYTDSAGEMELRREIARMVLAQRGVHCEPEQVIVQAGTQASLQNLLLLFDPQTDIIGMEEPGYDGVRSVFERSRFRMHPCPVDPNPNGKFVQACREGAPKLVYTTPSNQFPTGKVMPLETRKKIIEWAAEADAYLLEDDYCCEFLYSDRPLPSLKSLDRHGRVIYMGTFSKSLSPALRINYLILPPAILERWQHVFSNAYACVPWLSQAVLLRCLKSDQRTRQLRRTQTRCRKKYEALMNALRTYMGDRVDIMTNGAGLHLLVNVKDGRSQGELAALAREAGVRVYPTERYWLREENVMESCMLVGFSAIEEENIEPGIRTLAQAWFG